MVVAVGGSVAYGVIAGSDNKVCEFVQICPRLGAGFFAGVSGNVSPTIGSGAGNPSISVGVGGDIGYGLAAGGQLAVGFDPSVSGTGGIPGPRIKGKGRAGLGFGFGLSVGADLCFTLPFNCRPIVCR